MTTLRIAEREFRIAYVREAIVKAGSKRAAAKLLGIDRSLVYQILRRAPCEPNSHLVAPAESR